LNLAGCRKTCQKKKQILTYLFTDSWLFWYSRSNFACCVCDRDCAGGLLGCPSCAGGLGGGRGGLNLGPKNTKHNNNNNNNNILDCIYYIKPSSQNLGKCIIMKIPTNWK
jgi:hypothetical protein